MALKKQETSDDFAKVEDQEDNNGNILHYE